MIEVWFFLVLYNGVVQAGPFRTQSECEYARSLLKDNQWAKTHGCYRGVMALSGTQAGR